ncbi:protein of unknown function [Cupriavidus taiwanensis]|uniref:Uncharacterized protein n=1 Tax=Cupriavidus taiwanensis TaxID=164546 RepID=A0A7Z7JD69_9BURK|nr:protein of unknown function [Cupriavidus taiwanensis]SPC21155.1 protein of unknown function [Cupriavidus taiwanensis]
MRRIVCTQSGLLASQILRRRKRAAREGVVHCKGNADRRGMGCPDFVPENKVGSARRSRGRGQRQRTRCEHTG